MNIYISGPITGRTEYDCTITFAIKQSEVESFGHTPINPWAIGAYLPKLTHEQYIAIDLEIIKQAADAVYFMPGWRNSRGCVIEHDFCEKQGIPIIEKISDLKEVSA